MSSPQVASVPLVFERALAALGAASAAPIAIAYSGGLDSSALLHLAAAYGRSHGVPVFAFHIHHGISPNADAWLAHCESTCAALGVRFEATRVVLEKTKSGVEAAARNPNVPVQRSIRATSRWRQKTRAVWKKRRAWRVTRRLDNCAGSMAPDCC